MSAVAESDERLKVLVVANKRWECEPLVSVLVSKHGRPRSLGNFRLGVHPGLADREDAEVGQTNMTARPRLELSCTVTCFTTNPETTELSATARHADIQLFCIEDWMRSEVNGVRISISSSREKWEVALPMIKAAACTPDVVIAFGTAGAPGPDTLNGCVTLGSRVYIHDPFAGQFSRGRRKGEADPMLDLPLAEKERQPLGSPNLHKDFFHRLPDRARHSAEARFLKAPIDPADPPRVLASRGLASLGTINITDYDDYIWADARTRAKFESEVKQREIGSVETTHGLIRLFWRETTFLFLSGLCDEVGRFNMEVTPRLYAQNFVAAHNAGVTLAYLVPELISVWYEGALFADAQVAASAGQLGQSAR